MKICPSCHAEYREDVEKCFDCDEVLVVEEEVKGRNPNEPSLKQLKEGSQMVSLTQGPLPACREMEAILKTGGLASYLVLVKEEPTTHTAVIGATSIAKYAVIIAEEDLPKALSLLEKRFANLVMKEGKGALVTEAINLDDNSVRCPACGEEGPLEDGACTFCGLCLGVPNESAG